MNTLIVSAHHDYRTPNRASIHFVANELLSHGAVHFFSMRYSPLSRFKGDARVGLEVQANQVDSHGGVQCYLWKTPFHPMALRRRWLWPLEQALFWLYERLPCAALDAWAKQADVVIFESGIAPVLAQRIARLNPQARLIYKGNDGLREIGASVYAQRKLEQLTPHFAVVALVSKSMASRWGHSSLNGMAQAGNVFVVPHGVEDKLSELGDPTPYADAPAGALHAVSVGAMLFDPQFFVIAGKAFPDVTFHVIGSGHDGAGIARDNVLFYPRMPYAQTIRYIKHANFGIAPYHAPVLPAYLADSSLKMLQYDYFGLPTVCPYEVVGTHQGRFGYRAGSSTSIQRAIVQALASPHERTRAILSWAEVTQRLLQPTHYADTRI
jgi:2-beta-glucuronyltransferase